MSGLGAAGLFGVLLLLEQVVKAGLLLGRERVAKGGRDFPHLFLELGPHGVHDFPGPLLALADNGIDALFLRGGQAQFGLQAAQQVEPESAGYLHSLALTRDGTVVAWGAGQPNNPTDPFGFGQSTVPAGLNGVVAVAAGTWNSVALVGGPVLTPPAPQPGGSMQLTLNGIAGWRYTVSGSTDLVNWTPLTSFVATNASTQIVDPAAGSFSHRFYRATAP